jgi:hypothetical protein
VWPAAPRQRSGQRVADRHVALFSAFAVHEKRGAVHAFDQISVMDLGDLGAPQPGFTGQAQHQHHPRVGGG